MSFTAQIGQLTGSASSNDATTIAQALENATAEFIQKISQINPDLLYSMATSSLVANNDDGNLEFEKNSIVLNVYRNFLSAGITKRYNATRVDIKYESQVQDIDSVYYADNLTPVYVFDGSKVQIYPEPDQTTGQSAYIIRVIPGAINDNSETIANMPSLYHPQIVRIASYNVLLQRLGSLRNSLPTDLDADTTVFNAISDFNDSIGVTTSLPSISNDYSDAITKAKNLIDDVGNIGGDTNTDGSGVDIYSAQKWLIEEDPEMLQSTLSTAAQELQRAQSVLSGHSAEINKYQAEISKESAEAGQALQEYQANLTKKLQSFTTLIGKLTSDYQWMQNQLALIKQEINETYQSYSSAPVQTDIGRLGVRT